ncbi:transient receptor potential channel pyrexia isoform X2 [Neocloeon triangulifer]|nr:transient receptor potential channel pyrexia isoform X2 [Neocloeon triangulifer]
MSFREKMHGIRVDSQYDVVQKLNDELCPVDFSDSYEDLDEKLASKIGREVARNSILEMMRDLRGDIRILIEIEENNNLPIDLNGLNCKERQVLLLWAAFLKRRDILEKLLARSDCELKTSTPDLGLNALHLAAFSGCHECALLLLNSGAKMTHKADYSPLHCAAQSGSINCVKLLLAMGANVNSRSEDITNKEPQDTALHCAIKADSPEIVRELLKAGAIPSTLGQGYLAPLHVAADLGYMGCMRAILDFGKCGGGIVDINQQTKDGRGYTAIHLVAEDQFADGIRLLQEYGADCKIKTTKGLTALHLACREQSVECAKLLLTSCDINSEDNESRTPLHMALGRADSAEITEFLVSNPGIKVNATDKAGFTPLHIAALNEQVVAAAILIRAGADLTARTAKGSTALRMVIRKVPTALYAVEQVMDESISLTNNMDSRDVEIKMDFKPLLASKKRITTDLLNTFIAEGHPELMQHPLCQAFLHIKWQEVRIFYYLRLLYYILYLSCISIFVSYFLPTGCEGAIKEYKMNNTISEPSSDKCKINNIFVGFLYYIYIGTIWFTLLELIRKLWGLIAFIAAPTTVSIQKSLAIYSIQIDNWLEWTCLACMALVSASDNRQSFHVYIGAIAVLAGWSNLMVLVGQLPFFGAYVQMYTCVLIEMVKLLMAYVCMLLGFAISFHVMFNSEDSFSSFGKTIVKILVMMTGELEFNDLFKEEEKNITAPSTTVESRNVPETPPLSKFSLRLFHENALNELAKRSNVKTSMENTADVEVFAYIIFAVFLLLVTVVLMNLLVGIAVHDISGLRTSAVITRLQQQADLIGYIETALPNWCTLRCLLCCCLPFLGRTRSTTRRRRRTEMGVLSVKPHHWNMDSLPREIVSAAFEVAKKMNPYQGQAKRNTKPKPRYKRIYSKQHSGSIYDTIIPRATNLSRRGSQYLNIDKRLENFDSQSVYSANFDRSVTDDIRELKEALAEQSALLQKLLEANRIGSQNTLKPLGYTPNHYCDDRE